MTVNMNTILMTDRPASPAQSISGCWYSEAHTFDLLSVLIGACGGAARYIHETYKNQRPFKFLELIAKAFLSSFVGLSAGHLSPSWKLDFNTIFVFTSLFAWMGAEGAELMIQWIKKKVMPLGV
jgi:hypothetical protein